MDPGENLSVGALFSWTVAPALKAVEEYKETVKKYPNPPESNIAQFGGGKLKTLSGGLQLSVAFKK